MSETLPQIEQMRMGVDYSFNVKLRSFSVILRPLSNAEMMEAHSAVQTIMSGKPKHLLSRISEDNELAKEYLERASSPYGKFAPALSKPMLEQMTNEEVMYFYKEWMAVVDRVNPHLEKLSVPQLEEIVHAVKKNPSEDLHYQLTELSFGQLANLALYLLTKGD